VGTDDRQITSRPLIIPEIVTFPAEVDLHNARDLGTALIGAFGPGVAVVIADMTATTFCDSSGLRFLMVANDIAAERGADLRLVIPSRSVLRVFRLTGAEQLLRIYGSINEALSNAPQSGGPAGATTARLATEGKGRARHGRSAH
jgi:anti-sigma B factor antagonist